MGLVVTSHYAVRETPAITHGGRANSDFLTKKTDPLVRGNTCDGLLHREQPFSSEQPETVATRVQVLAPLATSSVSRNHTGLQPLTSSTPIDVRTRQSVWLPPTP